MAEAGKLKGLSRAEFDKLPEVAHLSEAERDAAYLRFVLGEGDALVNQARSPRAAIQAHRRHHNLAVDEIAKKYKEQGFEVIREPTFRGACGDGRYRPDLLLVKDGRIVKIVEVKGGDVRLSKRQREIFPNIISGDAYPRGRWIDKFDFDPGLPLKDQGYPNGIPIEVVRVPGAGQ